MATKLQLDNGSMDSGYAAAVDSKDIGIFKQEVNSLASLSTSSSAADADPRTLRRRISLLEKIPREFSTFIRTQSQTRRESASLLSDSSSLPSLTLDSAENEQQPSDKQLDMAYPEEMSARKSRRSENRFYNFLTSHSRSRSRSTSASNGDPSSHTKNEHPNNMSAEFSSSSSHSRNSSMSRSRDHHTDDGSKASTSKRSTVIPSRPLSTNTTATNTTITPTTPKSRRQATTAMLSPAATPKGRSVSARESSTPKADDTKKKRTIFGFSLPSSRRTSFNSSRGASPASTSGSRRGSLDLSSAPPVPKLTPPINPAEANNAAPHAHAPTSRSDKRRSADTDLSSRLKLGSSKNSSKTSVNQVIRVSHPRPKTSLQHLQAEAALMGNNGSVSRTSSDSNNYASSSTSFAPGHRRGVHSTPNTISQISDSQLAQSSDNSRASASGPQVGVSEFGAISRSSSSNGGRRGATSTDPGYRYHQPMAIVDEEPSPGKEAGGNASRLQTSSLAVHSTQNAAVLPSPTSTSAMKRTKHGSLDLHPRAVADRNGEGSSNGDGRPTTGGAGSLHVQYAVDRRLNRGTSPSPHSHETSTSSNSHSQSDHKSSSWGRSASKRGTMGSGGIAHLSSTSHGPFSFEPPVPSPTGSHASTAGGPIVKEASKGSMEVLKEKHRQEREREAHRERERQRELLREQERERRRREQAMEQRLPIRPEKGYNSVPSSPTLGFRSGTKGKQLDLDLGLSWAPTKIRQEALLPASSMRRTTSQGSSNAGVDPERLKIGKDIADSFRAALDDSAYAAFKKYVHRFDAHEIPLNGPNGIVARADRLLNTSTHLSPARKQYLLDNFSRVIMQNPA